jgi:two-component system chemotaxis response regulator CheY
MMVTTETEMAHIQRALLAGANEYVMKPFSKEIIEDKLRVLGVIDGLAHAS